MISGNMDKELWERVKEMGRRDIYVNAMLHRISGGQDPTEVVFECVLKLAEANQVCIQQVARMHQILHGQPGGLI